MLEIVLADQILEIFVFFSGLLCGAHLYEAVVFLDCLSDFPCLFNNIHGRTPYFYFFDKFISMEPILR